MRKGYGFHRSGAIEGLAGAAATAGMKAMSTALPAMMKAMTGIAAEMERAIANMPDPTYPRR